VLEAVTEATSEAGAEDAEAEADELDTDTEAEADAETLAETAPEREVDADAEAEGTTADVADANAADVDVVASHDSTSSASTKSHRWLVLSVKHVQIWMRFPVALLPSVRSQHLFTPLHLMFSPVAAVEGANAWLRLLT
jgi:hypothetical protein